MRFNLAILLVLVFQLLFSLVGKGQSIATEKVTLGLKDESLRTAIQRIEQQTSFRFFYREEDIRPLAHLNLANGTRTIEQTLNALIQNTDLSFRQLDGNILLKRMESQAFYTLSGRVLDSTDETPLANASVFLNNSTIGTITKDDGSFQLNVATPGKYELVVSMIGYSAYRKMLFIDGNTVFPDISIAPGVIRLSEVQVKAEPNRDRDYKWFKDEFLGRSNLPGKCLILNPGVIDLSYDKKSGVLTASSSDFIKIENQALGYRLKYLLTRFYCNKKTGAIKYNGLVWFENLTGDHGWQQLWEKNRLKTYRGSVMHFLRSALENQLYAEGFKVYRLKKNPNPEYTDGTGIKYIDILGKNQLRPDDFIKLTDKRNVYALSFKDCLYVMYTKLHNYTGNLVSIPTWYQPGYAKTTVTLDSNYIFFDNNGSIINPESVTVEGYWAESRVARLLPSDYEPANDK